MPDTNNTNSTPQSAEAQPQQATAAQVPPVPPVAPTPPLQHHEDHHSHTALYVILAIVGVLAVVALCWSAFAYFSPRGAWSPVPGVMSDYQYKHLEGDVRDDIKQFDNEVEDAYDSNSDSGSSSVPNANSNYISVDQAISTARAKVGQDSVYAVEFDEVNGKAVYVVDLNSGTTLYEVVIDATNGNVLDTQSTPYPGANQ